MQRSQRNPWIVLAGAILVIALAVGLLQGGAGAAPVGSAGYGGGGDTGGGTGNGQPPASCGGGGYGGVPCPSEVSNVSNAPSKPVKGKGFKVTFTSKSGGAYRVFVVRKGNKTILENGFTGAGKTTTQKVGKKLKAGKYSLRVRVQSSSRLKADVAEKTLKIVKP